MLDELKAMLNDMEQKERETVFEAAHAIGEAAGRKRQILEMIRKLEEERKVVEIAGKKVETAAKEPQTEKR